jgi:hypothetical protein
MSKDKKTRTEATQARKQPVWVDLNDSDSEEGRYGRTPKRESKTTQIMTGPRTTGKKVKGQKPITVVKVFNSRKHHQFFSRLLRNPRLSAQDAELASSFISPGVVYQFRLAREITFTSSVGGVVDANVDNDPSSYAEFTSLTALFSMVKIRRSKFQWIRTYSPVSPTVTGLGGFDPAVVNIIYDSVGVPSSYTGALDSPTAVGWNYAFDTSNKGLTLTLDYTGEHEPLWADVTSPTSTTDYVGCPGGAQIYLAGTTPSTIVVSAIQTLYLDFMNRV